ncbi:MAG: energy-coupling factor transporter transmembrane protein EcfT [Candidatus Bathyarchaeota archaeon]|nr:energy-coupling factor transporter transmembrane protein EcfT [Candidatus Bathyarchaeota archaeon]
MKRQTWGLHFDPRTKFFIVLLCGVFTFIVNQEGLFIFLALTSTYLLIQGMPKNAVKFTLAFALLYALQYAVYTYLSGIATIFGFILFFLARFIPVFMAASALSITPPGELIAALQKLHIPKAVIIPLAVGLRFTPCISQEFNTIRDAMHLRGIAISSFNTIAHPVMAMEYVLVPLLMRSMKISDELAASASARGIDNPGPRTCLRQIHFGLSDVTVLSVFCIVGVLIGLFFT